MKFVLGIILLFLPLSVGYSAQKVRVGVLDSGLDITDTRFSSLICANGSKDFTGTGLIDHMGHGTHVTGLIKQYSGNKDYCFVIVKYIDNIFGASQKTYLDAVSYIVDQKLDVLNYSGGGVDYDRAEENVYRLLSTVKIFAAAGNHSKNIDQVPFYPASLPFDNITIVSALGLDGNPASFTNWSRYSQWEPGEHILSTLPYSISKDGVGFMDGSSMATAIATGKFIHANY